MKCKRLLSLTLASAMLFGSVTMLPQDAFSFESSISASAVSSGKCGEDLYWELDDEGVLTISGTGDMFDYAWNDVWDESNSPFSDNSKIVTVNIAPNVTSICKYAFYNCTGLKNVTISDDLKIIGVGAFAGCESLASVTIPRGVTNIGKYTFSGCKSLESVTIQDSITSIGDDAFGGCGSLTSVTIPSSVTSIGSEAFSNCPNLTSVKILNGVENIGSRAFDYCKSLTSVTIPGSVTSIGSEAFSATKWLEDKQNTDPLVVVNGILIDGQKCSGDVIIPSSVTSICDMAFSCCKSLTSVTIPGSVTRIGSKAFSDCNNLTSVIIQNGVKSIEEWAFYECNNLMQISLPKSIDHIGENALGYYLYERDEDWELYDHNSLFINCYSGSEGERYSVVNGFDHHVHEFVTDVVSPSCVHEGFTRYTCECGENYTDDHIAPLAHNWSNWETTSEPSCTETGEKSRRCSYCGLTEILKIDAKGHNFGDWIVTKSATCTQNGNKIRVCDDCNAVERGTVRALGHNYKTTVVKPNCSAKGYTLHKCMRCEDSYKDTYTDMTAHKWSDWKVTKNPTTTSTGTKERSCTVCGKKETASVPKQTHTHSFTVTKVVAPTCTAKGYTLYTCKVCGETKKDKYTNALGHTWSSWTTTKKATCTAVGTQKRTCSVCKKAETKAIAKLGHSYKATIVKPTCSANGYTLHKCTRCGDFYKDTYTNTTAHKWSSWTTTKKATCTAAGTQKRTCSVCKKAETKAIAKLGHSYKATIVKPTATSSGYTLHKCSRCGASYKDNYNDNIIPQLKTYSNGVKSRNVSENNYEKWAKTVKSYIYEDSSKNLWRAEYINSKIIIEKYSQRAEKLLKSYTVKPELPMFGGVFFGKDYNYVVSGRSNPDYDDKVEVLRVTKYTREWKKVDHASVYGANTCDPFDAGSCRMTEAAGKFYVDTCHTMYPSRKDGANHQANMCFVINEAEMNVIDGHSETWTASIGYVSHSFNQFIQTDGKRIFRIDHGDAYPRGIPVFVNNVDGSIRNVNYTIPITFDGGIGSNWTGASIGGLEASSDTIIFPYNQEHEDNDSIRNVFVNVTTMNLDKSYQKNITEYGSSSKVTGGTPQIVKVKNDLYVVLWEETNISTGIATVRAVAIDRNGNKKSNVGTIDGNLSDCQPILCNDGCIRWYVTNNCSPVFYAIQPNDVGSLHIHKFSSKITKKPTCTAAGVRTYTCSFCGETKTESIKATGHTWAAWKTTKKSTCTADGVQTRTCLGCKMTETRAIAKLGHSYKATIVKPTCSAKGYTLHKCTRCGDFYKDSYTNITAHKWSRWTTTSFSFKNNTSVQVRKCSVCGKNEKQTAKNIVTRFAGANRYDTAALISKGLFNNGTGTVIIASGMDYHDALVAVPLAKVYNAPLLLTTDSQVTKQTEAELVRLKAKKVIIVSTNGSVGSKVRAALKKYNPTVISGASYSDTSVKVAETMQKKMGKAPDTIFFATSSSFADALSACPVAATNGAPIIYLPKDGDLDYNTSTYLWKVDRYVKNAYVIGGDGVISNSMMKSVAYWLDLQVGKTVVRVAGMNRYETCVAVNKKFKSVLSTDGICVAKGLDFPDALAGGVYAAMNKRALFLADGKKLLDVQNSYLKGKNAAKITVFGGTGAVSDELVMLIAQAGI